MQCAWISLFWVGFSDLYVRLVSMGIITDYNTSEDYYEGYIKKIIEKDILNDKLLSYISTYNFYPFITETFILYNKYLSIFGRKLNIKVKDADGLNTKIS